MSEKFLTLNTTASLLCLYTFPHSKYLLKLIINNLSSECWDTENTSSTVKPVRLVEDLYMVTLKQPSPLVKPAIH